MSATTTTRRPQAGPPLVVPAVASIVLTIAGAIAFAGGPGPDTSTAATATYLRDNQGLVGVAAFLIFATSLPLAVFSAAIYRRLRRLGVTAPGSAIAFAGGLLASASLAVSGLVVSGLILGLVPRPLAWAGIALAVAGAASTLGLVSTMFYPLLPITRFGGLAWLIVMSVVLPIDRHRRAVES